MTITLPLPPKELHPNGRYHHMAKARATKQYRTVCGWEAVEAKRSLYAHEIKALPKMPWKDVTVQAAFYFKRNGRRDGDNLNASIKAAIDSLQDAGVILNDSGVTLLPAIQAIDAKEPRVELTVRPGC